MVTKKKIDNFQVDATITEAPIGSPQTEQLLAILESTGQDGFKIAQMLKGAWIALTDSKNPESYVHSAHSARELMQKAPQYLPDSPVLQGSGQLNGEVKKIHQSWGKLKISYPWPKIVDKQLSEWFTEVGKFFIFFDSNYQERRKQAIFLIKALDIGRPPLPNNLIGEKAKEWMELSDYFTKVAHHGVETNLSEMDLKLNLLEKILLDLRYPRPIPIMDEIDILISEGVSK